MQNVPHLRASIHPVFIVMLSAIAPATTQATYNPTAGIVIRENGKSRPASMDEIEQRFGQTFLDDVMSNPGSWLNV